MKKILTASALALVIFVSGTASAEIPQASSASSCRKTFTVAMFRNAAITTYRGTRTPTRRELAHLRRFMRCGRKPWTHYADARIWARSRRMNAARRSPPLLYGNWAIPAPIVMCESGGQNLPPNSAGASGYYQIIPGTWAGYGGSGYTAYLASKSEQDAVASRIWNGGSGANQWVCAGLTGY